MKRTAELIMTIIAIILNVFGAGLLLFLTIVSGSSVFREGFQEGYNEEAIENGLEYNTGEADMVLSFISGLGWTTIIATIIGIILGIIAVFFFMGNKKPKAASILVLIGAVVVLFGTFFSGFLPAVLYAIAGIVGLVRKTPPSDDTLEDLTVTTDE